MPMVDNPFDFGRIATANAISDIFCDGRQTDYGDRDRLAGRLTLSPDIARVK